MADTEIEGDEKFTIKMVLDRLSMMEESHSNDNMRNFLFLFITLSLALIGLGYVNDENSNIFYFYGIMFGLTAIIMLIFLLKAFSNFMNKWMDKYPEWFPEEEYGPRTK